jgi:hypothetical protein
MNRTLQAIAPNKGGDSMFLLKFLQMLVVSMAIIAATPCEAGKVVVAYLLLDIVGPDVAEKLRSASLGNCKQLLVGGGASDEQILQLRCDEREGASHVTSLNQAVMQLAQVVGVKRATVLVVKAESQ